jgi:hypothetical protein
MKSADTTIMVEMMASPYNNEVECATYEGESKPRRNIRITVRNISTVSAA